MFDPSKIQHVYIACGYTDLRRGIDGLVSIVQHRFQLDPFANALFLFCGRRTDRFKALYWDSDGFLLLYKRLERGRFTDPARLSGDGLAMSELLAWLDGIDLSRTRRLAPVAASVVG